MNKNEPVNAMDEPKCLFKFFLFQGQKTFEMQRLKDMWNAKWKFFLIKVAFKAQTEWRKWKLMLVRWKRTVKLNKIGTLIITCCHVESSWIKKEIASKLPCIDLGQVRKSDVVANSDADFGSEIRWKSCEIRSWWKHLRLFERHFALT